MDATAWVFLGILLAGLVAGAIFHETVLKRRFMRRMWDHDRIEWKIVFGSDEDFEKRRGPRP
jgi:hypothetical protein